MPFSLAARSGPARMLLGTGAVSRPTAFVCEPTSSALVLGSTQRESDVDLAVCVDAGLEVLRRHSGGGAVIVRPGAQVWIDVFVPFGHSRFVEDVLVSFEFLGEAWRAGLVASIEAPHSSLRVVTAGSSESTRWSRLACFAGCGAGEVLLDGRKVVGISQRRSRAGTWLHSMAMLEFDPFELPRLLALPRAKQNQAGAWLARNAVSVPGGSGVGPSLTSAVLHQLR